MYTLIAGMCISPFCMDLINSSSICMTSSSLLCFALYFFQSLFQYSSAISVPMKVIIVLVLFPTTRCPLILQSPVRMEADVAFVRS